jgi:hypothetical protein
MLDDYCLERCFKISEREAKATGFVEVASVGKKI